MSDKMKLHALEMVMRSQLLFEEAAAALPDAQREAVEREIEGGATIDLLVSLRQKPGLAISTSKEGNPPRLVWGIEFTQGDIAAAGGSVN